IGSNLSTQDFIQKRLGVRDDLTRQSGGQHVFKGGLSVDFVTYDIDKRNNETPQFEYAQYVDNNYGWTTDTTQTKFNFRNPYLLTYGTGIRSEEHTSELQSRGHLVCRLLLEKKNAP